MSILVSGARIIDPSSPFHQQMADVLIREGKVAAIGSGLSDETATHIDANGACLSPGFLDPFAHFCDPGQEYKETLLTGAEAAAAGGYTDVLLLPNTKPVMHHRAALSYICSRHLPVPVQLHPLGAITKDTEGKELAEMYDMGEGGAPAFTDGLRPVQSAGLMLKALLYVKATGGVLVQLPDDRSIQPLGLMNESVLSSRLGLPGRPVLAEELMVQRDLELLRYTGSRLHITGITSAASLQHIRRAKEEGLQVTCSVTPMHLHFTEEALGQYDTNFKLQPPLRSEEDRAALCRGLAEGWIDCLASHHLPEDRDGKIAEFEAAAFGAAALETAFSALRTALPQMSAEDLADRMSIRPRHIFNQPIPRITEGARARYTLFSMDEEWTPRSFRSRGINQPFAGRSLKGRVMGIINGDRLFLTQ